MLGQRNRFHGRGSLKNVYQRGKSVRSPLISLKYYQRDPNRPYRVAVIVSRKVSKSAVKRNRIRRRVYEAVRRSPEQPQGGTDLVLTVFNEAAAEIDSKKMAATIEELIKQANAR